MFLFFNFSEKCKNYSYMVLSGDFTYLLDGLAAPDIVTGEKILLTCMYVL